MKSMPANYHFLLHISSIYINIVPYFKTHRNNQYQSNFNISETLGNSILICSCNLPVINWRLCINNLFNFSGIVLYFTPVYNCCFNTA